jgi:hypothetical protein
MTPDTMRVIQNGSFPSMTMDVVVSRRFDVMIFDNPRSCSAQMVVNAPSQGFSFPGLVRANNSVGNREQRRGKWKGRGDRA